jgi:hypothetical protein
MCTKKNCFSPSSWIGEATAMNASKRAEREDELPPQRERAGRGG